jgi:hypothetical protein
MAPGAVVMMVVTVDADADAERADVGADDGGVGGARAQQGEGEDGCEKGFHGRFPEG